MGIKVKGISQARKNLNALVGDIQGRKTIRAMQSALIIGGSQATLYTPIDTSTLINSQFREITVNGNRVTGRVGYSASYASYVHDPSIPQNFRRATARKEFLTKGFEDMQRQIDAVIAKEMSL
ncbi:HK97 gp10 family phage protein [Escherichia coli]|uniref:HK97 gp10 family phage protein n=1 Tax=Escherichia coli TaxID=562 RepID=UPI001FF15AFC|nr:HK97 gp10 family phage protein [Escherichia coli]MDB7221295.1 HK97 gp10 family phage protein [Escherichia coli]MDB7244515.1 HK97 gp10 family phage protein [Escherichia coli]MDB8032678.1 HK97 gp10 family phage protein [Escherichia coli]